MLKFTFIHRRTSRGSEEGCSPPVTEILKFFGQNADDSGKVFERKCSIRLSKPDLRVTFSDVCLVKTELKSNDLRIQVFVLEKPYIVYMCIIEIYEMNIASINKTNEDL